MGTANKPTVIALVGPTASGKTALSLALAQSLSAEIIACDSRTVYRYFDIGTAKPSLEERQLVQHHLIDIAEPTDNYTVALYVRNARSAIDKIMARNKKVIICGGTGFYARALLEGLVIPEVEPQPELRESLRAIAQQEGNEVLHQRLAQLDPITAAHLNPNDQFRIIRALEVTLILGKPFSQAIARSEEPYNTIWIGLTANNRSYLNDIIHKRFQAQMAAGMLEETQELLSKYGAHQKLMNTVNYKELVGYLQGQMSLEDALKTALQHNCQLARRQLIWFRANKQIKWFAIDEQSPAELVEAVEKHFISLN